jgi:hypothetical protein
MGARFSQIELQICENLTGDLRLIFHFDVALPLPYNSSLITNRS